VLNVHKFHGREHSSFSGPEMISFYAYRAQSDDPFHVENANLANLAGALKYAHYEVINSQEKEEGLCQRHYAITRIARYKLTMKNPQDVYDGFGDVQPQFGPFMAFDQGQCTSCLGPDSKIWEQLGFYVGCQKQDEELFQYEGAEWYSLPGPCPHKGWGYKDAACRTEHPGGECTEGQEPDGIRCTWRIEERGEVRLDELSGIQDYYKYCQAGHVEYSDHANSPEKKQGGVCFWNDRDLAVANKERVEAVRRLFKLKYPHNREEILGSQCEF